jgi:hypothetical protein
MNDKNIKQYHETAKDLWVEYALKKIRNSPLAHPKDPSDPYADFDIFAYDEKEE